MKRHKQSFIFLLSLLLVFVPVIDVSAQTIRIMPLGNSITEGSDLVTPVESQRVSYRQQLFNDLTTGGYNFDFVGHGNSGWASFADPDHAGIPGSRGQHVVRLLQDGYDDRWNEQITPGSQPYLDVYPADIILLHIGTNDIIPSGDDAGAISDILDEIDAWEASSGTHVTVFVAKIINSNPDTSIITDYNTNLTSIVNGRGDPSVILVDMENGAGIDYPTEMMLDGIHPLPAAYIKMGQTWYAALDAYLSAAPDNLTFNPITSNSIYPNPVTDMAYIELELYESGDVKIEIIDSRGRVVSLQKERHHGAGIQKFEWDGTNEIGVRMPEGIYFTRISSSEGIWVEKFLIK